MSELLKRKPCYERYLMQLQISIVNRKSYYPIDLNDRGIAEDIFAFPKCG